MSVESDLQTNRGYDVIESVAALLGRATGLVDDDPEVVYECRRCGRTVDPETEVPEDCPDCPDGELVRYEVE